MGNRAVIAFENMPTMGIYLHWNGGPESILAFLEAAKVREYRSPATDCSYAAARLVGLLCDFFDNWGSTSIGIGPLSGLDCDNGNNGLYWIGPDWDITRREFNGEDLVTRVDQLTDIEPYSQRARYVAMLEALTTRPAAATAAA